jgi:hypothetical protein
VEATPVLVLSADALVAALLGALMEIEGYAPWFPRAHETPRDALRRVRPHALLLDGEYPDACGPTVIGPARMMGVRVVLFARPDVVAAVQACATRYELEVLPMPPRPNDVASVLGVPANTPVDGT